VVGSGFGILRLRKRENMVCVINFYTDLLLIFPHQPIEMMEEESPSLFLGVAKSPLLLSTEML
jgi:hypothetical protein